MAYEGLSDRNAIEAEGPWADRELPKTIYQMLADVAQKFPQRPAFSYQLTSGPQDPRETLSWQQVHDTACQTANLFRELGVEETDVVAYVLPNACLLYTSPSPRDS